jgi:hypothetical protein
MADRPNVVLSNASGRPYDTGYGIRQVGRHRLLCCGRDVGLLASERTGQVEHRARVR